MDVATCAIMFISSKKASAILGLHPNTLRKYADEERIKHIKTESEQRRYDVQSYIGEATNQITVCYCRVSSYKQKDDLERQVKFMHEKFPQAEIIKDIGSELNFKRKGLKAILEQSLCGNRTTLMVACRDRLAGFGFELIRWVIERNGGKVMVLDESSLSPEEELTKDLLSILHVFSCRMHGLRNYKKQVSEALSNEKPEKDI